MSVLSHITLAQATVHYIWEVNLHCVSKKTRQLWQAVVSTSMD